MVTIAIQAEESLAAELAEIADARQISLEDAALEALKRYVASTHGLKYLIGCLVGAHPRVRPEAGQARGPVPTKSTGRITPTWTSVHPLDSVRYSFIGIGHSGKGDVSQRVDETLDAIAERRKGWSLDA